MLLVGEVAAAAGTAALPMAGGSTVTVLVAACVGTAVPMFFGSAINIALVTVVGEDIGDGYFARVSALITTGATLANLLGALLGGVLGERIGARAGIWAFVGLDLVAVVVLAVVVGRRSFAGRPAAAGPLAAAGSEPAAGRGGPVMTSIRYPDAAPTDTVDVLHGHRVADPYRWLEEPDGPASRRWLAEQQAVTDSYLGSLPGQDRPARDAARHPRQPARPPHR